MQRARTVTGVRVIRADVIPDGDAVEVRVQLEPGASTEIAQLPDGRGFVLLVAIRAPSEGAATVTPAQPGSYALYYLGDAAVLADLDYAVRRNAAAGLADTTDAVRREILLGLLNDLALGRRYAESLQRELLLIGGYTGSGASAAPLAVLTGAAGRGLLLEFSPEDLTSQRLPVDLAAALMTVLSDGALP